MADELFGISEVTNFRKEFVVIESLKNQKIKKVSGTSDHIIALAEEGNVFVWENNCFGQLGLGNMAHQRGAYVEITDISAGISFSVFVDTEGYVWAIGGGSNGQTLFKDRKERLSFERVPNIEKVTAVSCGDCFTYAQISGSPVFDAFTSTEPNTGKILEQKFEQNLIPSFPPKNKNDEKEMKNQKLKEKLHCFQDEKEEADQIIAMLSGQKEEIEHKFEFLEKEKKKATS